MWSIVSRYLVVIAVVCSACSTARGPKFTPPTDIDREAALVFVYRGGGMIGADRSYSILANNAYVGTFAQYSYTVFSTKRTDVSFAWVWESSNYALRFAGMLSGVDVSPELQGVTRLLSIDVEPGKAYFVKLSPTVTNAYASLALVTPEAGEHEISAYHLWADHWTDQLTLGNAALAWSDYAKAESHYQTALTHLDRAPIKCAEALTYNYLGISFYNQHQHGDAEAAFTQSITLWEQCGGTEGLRITMENYAEFLRAQDRSDEAAAVEARIEALK